MAQKTNLTVEVLDSQGRDVTDKAPFFQDLLVNTISLQRVADYPNPTGDATIPNYVLTLMLHDLPMEGVGTPPKDGETPKKTRKQTPAQRAKALRDNSQAAITRRRTK